MSMLGGQFEHVRQATSGNARHAERHQIHSIYTQGSKQGVDDTMRALERQLEWMATVVTDPVEVQTRSDKCKNYTLHHRRKCSWLEERRGEAICADNQLDIF
jgi:hypothetical protein